MAEVKRKKNGEWVDIGQEVLKTDITVEEIVPPQPLTIVAGEVPYLVSDKLAFYAPSRNYEASGIKITVPKNGTYTFKAGFGMGSSAGTAKCKLMKNGTQIGTEQSLGTAGFREVTAENIACVAGDEVEVYLQGGSSSSSNYYGYCGALIAFIDWDGGI